MHRISSVLRYLVNLLYWRIGLEALIWTAGLVYLAVHNPYAEAEFSICPFRNLGFHFCPGCGLGRAVSFLLHGDIVRSVQTHILGIPATIILVYRTLFLLNGALKKQFLQATVH